MLFAAQHARIFENLGVALLDPAELGIGAAILRLGELLVQQPCMEPAAITMFGLLFAAAIVYRRQPQHHKRLMMIATVSLTTTPLARIGRMIGGPFSPPIMGMLFTDLFIVALAAFDLRTRGRLHPATAIGGGLFLLSQIVRVAMSQWPAWQTVAASLGAR